MQSDCDVAAVAAVGSRSEQQDAHGQGRIALAAGNFAVLLVLADGMGGEIGGRLASSIAVRAFVDAAQDGPASNLSLRLREALVAANQAIAAAIAEDSGLNGMGCTLIGLAIDGDRATWVSVGDSLLLRSNAGEVTRLNDDHSMAPALDEAARRGEISNSDALTHLERSVLLSALTGRPIALIDEQSIPLIPGDCFIVASDGLLTLEEARIRVLTRKLDHSKAQILASQLLAEVLAAKSPEQDNVTIMVVRTTAARATRRHAVGARGIALLVAGVAVATAAATLLLTDLAGKQDRPVDAAGEQGGAGSSAAEPRAGISVPDARPMPAPDLNPKKTKPAGNGTAPKLPIEPLEKLDSPKSATATNSANSAPVASPGPRAGQPPVRKNDSPRPPAVSGKDEIPVSRSKDGPSQSTSRSSDEPDQRPPRSR